MSTATGNAIAAPVEDGRAKWAEIARRAQEATGSDENLDAEVLCAAFGGPGSWVEQSHINGAWCVFQPSTYGAPKSRLLEHYPHTFRVNGAFTSSVDAMLALIAEKLPGRGFVGVDLDIAAGAGGAQASIEHSPDPCSGSVQEIGATPALALLAAFALAMEAQHDR